MQILQDTLVLQMPCLNDRHNSLRPGRFEARTIKRRVKTYSLLNRPREELRKRPQTKEVVA